MITYRQLFDRITEQNPSFLDTPAVFFQEGQAIPIEGIQVTDNTECVLAPFVEELTLESLFKVFSKYEDFSVGVDFMLTETWITVFLRKSYLGMIVAKPSCPYRVSPDKSDTHFVAYTLNHCKSLLFKPKQS